MTQNITRLYTLAAAATLLLSPAVEARSPDGRKAEAGPQTWMVVLEEAPLVERMVREEQEALARLTQSGAPAGKARVTPLRRQDGKLDLETDLARSHLHAIDRRFGEFEAAAAAALGKRLEITRRFRTALNGFTVRLTAAEAERLAELPGVAGIERERTVPLHTYAGPEWIGARDVWEGAGFLPESRGEGVIVGIIDSGINWDHPAFADPGEGLPPNATSQHDHENPLGEELGLCSREAVLCNDKLIGVYDFTDDEQFNEGRDNTQHGTHVASIAAGNPLSAFIAGAPVTLSGVAPNANIVSYRVCYPREDDSGPGICSVPAIIDAVNQAIRDGVDVLNLSLGGGQRSPWSSTGEDRALLNAVQAGITVVTSAGNDGPADNTLTNPGIAPWAISVGSADSGVQLAAIAKASQGGDTDPPGDLYGEAFQNQGVSLADIVYAGDYDHPLCGVGEPELEAACDDNTGSTKPPEWGPDTFAGKIVVCDRGDFGRVEKGKNVQLAGAVGMILANTASSIQSVVPDQHCLPSAHIDREDGDRLRAWLASGDGHQGSITKTVVVPVPGAGDQLSSFSSRGPSPAVSPNVLKPEVIAPGDTILAADGDSSNGFIFLSGTSMASPHVAGGVALIKSVHSAWTPRMIASALQTTATDEIATDENGIPATRNEVGHGRPRLGEAVQAALYFDVSYNSFLAANPTAGGNPGDLNLPSMTDVACVDVCTFTRTVKPLVTGITWTVSTRRFPAGAEVTVTPSEFTLNAGEEQELSITVDLGGAGMLNQWVFGDVVLSDGIRPDAVLPMAVFASVGVVPQEWRIASDRDAGSATFTLDEVTALPQATFTAGGLVEPASDTRALPEDPTAGDPYDTAEGTFTILYDVPPGALWLHAETLASEAEDLDLFVGRDRNGNGRADEFEQVCASTTPEDLELCDIFEPQAGVWWVLVQNWEDGEDGPPGEGPQQDATLVSAVISAGADSRLLATGPGRTESLEPFEVQLAWEDVSAAPGATLLGAVGIGSDAQSGNNVGVIPLRFQRTGIQAVPSTPTAVYPGRGRSFALAAGAVRNDFFFDVPASGSSLTVLARGAVSEQTENLSIELYRRSFDDAFVTGSPLPPPPPAGSPVASDSGSGGGTPSITLAGGDLEPGRWYVAVSNGGEEPAQVGLEVELEHDAPTVPMQNGMLDAGSSGHRPAAISQGIEYGEAGPNRAVLWYTYGGDGLPTWYLASAPAPAGDSWVADLFRFTNDGATQQPTLVGDFSITLLGEGDGIMTWSFGGASGSDRIAPTVAGDCPSVGGTPRSYTGIWGIDQDGPLQDGIGGATVVMNAGPQAQVHYLYDDAGNPRWLIGASGDSSAPTFELLQFTGQCPTCDGVADGGTVVGAVTREYSSETAGSWTLDYVLQPPLKGDVERTDAIFKITDRYGCE